MRAGRVHIWRPSLNMKRETMPNNAFRHWRQSLYFDMLSGLPLAFRVILETSRRNGRIPNIIRPTLFNDKIAHRKIFDRNPRLPHWVDKIRAKELAAQIVGKDVIIPTLWTGTDVDRIPFDSLEAPYVLKPAHSSQCTLFVTESSSVDKEAIKRELLAHLKTQWGKSTGEWAYFNVPRNIIIEKMISDEDGNIPDDYKFHVFGGKAHFIQIDVDRQTKHVRAFYSPTWEKLDLSLHYPQTSKPISRPENIEGMLRVAEAIGSEFQYVRVDLYDVLGSVYFGETTFYPGAGFEQFVPSTWDRIWGELWKLDS